MNAQSESIRLFVSIPETLVERPIVYEIITRFDVVPNIRRAGVDKDSGWIIFELGPHGAREDAITYLEDLGCIVDRMEGDVVAG